MNTSGDNRVAEPNVHVFDQSFSPANTTEVLETQIELAAGRDRDVYALVEINVKVKRSPKRTPR